MPLIVRASELSGMSHLTGKRLECKPSSVSDHLFLRNYDSDFDKFTILCQDHDGFRLLLKKSVLISRDSPVFNKNTVSFSFSNALSRICFGLYFFEKN